MGFLINPKQSNVARLHLISLLLCIVTSPFALSAPNRVPLSGSDGSISSSSTTNVQESSSSSVGTGGSGSSSTSSSEYSSSSTIFTMFSQGEQQVDVEKHNKSAIFLLGNKGSGQSDLAQTIIANYQLENSGSMDTSSFAPQYLVNQENSMAFYNFPGFEASRNPEDETANAYFMEKVTKHVSQIKFLFTISHSSIQQTSGGSNAGGTEEFDLLVTNAAKLMTPSDTGKFTNSIGLVVTNVQGAGMKDQEILSGAESFMTRYKDQLTVQLETPGLDQETRILIQRKITFVETLLRKGSGGSTSLNGVWFLRTRTSGTTESPGNTGTTPSNPGTTPGNPGTELPEDELHARRNITDLYLNRLQFSSVTHSDFTVSLATQTLAAIQSKFAPEISSLMQNFTTSAVQTTVSSYYTNFFQNAFINQNANLPNALQTLSLNYNNIIQSGMVTVYEDLTSAFTHPMDPTPHVFHMEVFTKLSQFLNVPFPSSYLSSMNVMTHWLAFFQQVTNTFQTGPTITETAVLSSFNQIRTFKDRVNSQICSANCGGTGIPGIPFHIR